MICLITVKEILQCCTDLDGDNSNNEMYLKMWAHGLSAGGKLEWQQLLRVNFLPVINMKYLILK